MKRPARLGLIAPLGLAVVVAACSNPAPDAAPSSTTRAVATTTIEVPAPATTAEPASTATTPITGTASTTTTSITPPPASSTIASTIPSTPPDDRYPDQPDGVPWPTAEWSVGEPPANVDVAAIDAAVHAAFGPADNSARLRAFVAVQGGQIVYERYHPLDNPDTVLSSFSVAKSVTSTLVGMLVDDGDLDVAAPAPVEEWADPSDPRSAITLEHLLQMRSGLTWEEIYEPGRPLFDMLSSQDWAAYVIDRPLESEPGTMFDYSTGTTAVLAEIVADAVGGPDALDAFIETDLLEPLGIESATLVEDPTGQFVGGIGFDSTARDFARFGLMVVRGGWWDGQQIVSSNWLDAATTPSPALAAYGYQWWLAPNGDWFAARGLFGQLILVAPDLDLVIVANTTQGGDSETPAMTALDAFGAAG